MTIENLKTVSAELYKAAEEAIPVLGNGDKKQWMSDRLNEIIEKKEPILKCLLGYKTTAEVLDLLDKEYEERKEDVKDKELPCAKEQSKSTSTHKTKTTKAVAGKTKTDKVVASKASGRKTATTKTTATASKAKANKAHTAKGTVITAVGYIDPGIIVEEEILIIEDVKPTRKK